MNCEKCVFNSPECYGDCQTGTMQFIELRQTETQQFIEDLTGETRRTHR